MLQTAESPPPELTEYGCSELRARLSSGRPMTLYVPELSSEELLELLADGASYHVEVETPSACAMLEIGNGIVMGARAEVDGKELEGFDAYVAFTAMDAGTVHLEPRRFLTMANILKPIRELTGRTLLPEKRSKREPTIKGFTERELERRARRDESGPRVRRDRTMKRPAAPIPATRPYQMPRTQRLRPWLVGLALVLVVGVGAALWGGGVLSPNPTQAAVEPEPPHRQQTDTGAPSVAVVPSGESTDVEELATHTVDEAASTSLEADLTISEDDLTEEEVEPTPDHAEARRLARESRRRIRRGQHRVGLAQARRAAHLRPDSPYYQVVLGDALAANGRRVAATRAYRRALRLNDDYRPAQRRLGITGSSSPS